MSPGLTRVRATLLLVGIVAVIVGAFAMPARAATDGGIRVVQVQGLLDPPNADLIERAVDDANDDGAALVVIQLDTVGATGNDMRGPLAAIDASDVPIAVWVGPSGAEARGAGALLYAAAHVSAVSPGSHVGPASPQRLDTPGDPTEAATLAEVTRFADDDGQPRWDDEASAALTTDELSAKEAADLGISEIDAPTLGEFLVSLDELTVVTASGPQELDVAKVTGEGDDRRREPNQEVRFVSLQVGPRIEHTLTSPSIAYLLFAIGGALILFEFFTISVGVAGGVGAIALIGACIGFANLPVQWWAAALIAAGIVGFGVDVQVQRFGFWSIAGGIFFVIGSWFLYGGSSLLDPPWWVLLLVIVGMFVFMLGGMTSVVRSRFSTPTVGREDLVGEMGLAQVDVSPDGVVEVRGARWRARTNRATPISMGDTVRVVAVEGVVLEVEPETGGAMDYRDRARKRGRTGSGDDTAAAPIEPSSNDTPTDGTPTDEPPADA